MITRVPLPVRVGATISVWFSGVEQTGAPPTTNSGGACRHSGILLLPRKIPFAVTPGSRISTAIGANCAVPYVSETLGGDGSLPSRLIRTRAPTTRRTKDRIPRPGLAFGSVAGV